MGFEWLLGRILDDFWCQLGAKMGAKTMQNEVPEPLEKVSENLWNKGKVNDDLREILVESLHIKLVVAAHKARRTVFFRTHSFRYSGSRALGACVWWWFRNLNIFVLSSKRHVGTPLSHFGSFLSSWYPLETFLWQAKNDDPCQLQLSFLIFTFWHFVIYFFPFLKKCRN